jgi:transcriptional regulator with XRE-family HTH domain
MSTISLKHRTRELLEVSGLSDREVADKLDVSITWVTGFRRSMIKSPNVDTIQQLYEMLSGAPLLRE